ncbi:MAG: SDR family oxidoreductase [Litorilinea sp.]
MNTGQISSGEPVSRALAGKVAVITGSGRGIGRGIALALAAQGCHVVVNYMRRRREAEATAAAVAALGVKSLVVQAHLGRSDDAQRLVDEAVAQLGSVDIFVGNAASGVLRPMTELTAREWDWTMGINVQGLLTAVQRAVPHMRAAGWGRIITLTSIGSRRVFPDYGMVGTSKAALEAMTRYLAIELAPAGIGVNCVSPGLVDTGALESFPRRAEMIEHAQRNTPAGRLVTPEDVGRVVAWLCGPGAAMIVGQTIEVDGGYSLGMLQR